MDQLVLTNSQLEQFTEIFVNDFCVDKTETSKIIAGMTAIIDGNEAALDQMKNQKWFQRIWYTMTGKNKATVREMQLKRDDFSKFTIMVINRLLYMTSCNSWMIENLSSAFTMIRSDMAELEISVNELAHRLNEKIESIDNYNNIITDIQNNIRYDNSKSLLSAIDVMSQIDYVTASNTDNLKRIKETMQRCGYDFDKFINTDDFAEQIWSLREHKEKIGRIYVFCQKYSDNLFINYACRIIEYYFYQSETNSHIFHDERIAVIESRRMCKLSEKSQCRVGMIVDELMDSMYENSVMTKKSLVSPRLKTISYIDDNMEKYTLPKASYEPSETIIIDEYNFLDDSIKPSIINRIKHKIECRRIAKQVKGDLVEMIGQCNNNVSLRDLEDFE